ncbi:CzcE family metal-binding protein [uncultured Aquimonas sp.]|uniref:CzcE family metal-binding protein n=1 Tax=uncultured Aquimonas sp. TaxID=385483 RepID=UPI0026244976|nr:CzcE family metal-binding protein [uncultured Aquimonas sp.]
MNNMTPARVLLAIASLGITMAAAAAGPDTFRNGQSYYGQVAATAAMGKTVDLGSTKYLNVEYGETITFRNAGRQFSWTFNGLDRRSVDVSKIAPPGFTSKPFVVYIAEDPNNRR